MSKHRTDAAFPDRRPRVLDAIRAIRRTGILLAIALMSACAGSPPSDFEIVAYNVQNLFDDVADGDEYSEFDPASGWTRARYFTRLERIDEVIRLASGSGLPDLIVLSEVEHPRIAGTLSYEFLRRYRFLAASPERRSTTGLVMLLKWPPHQVRTHAAVIADLLPHGSSREAASPLSVRVRWRSRAQIAALVPGPAGPLLILAAHWKSQRGGERATEAYRVLEARLARNVMERYAASGTTDVLLVGDLNEDLEEFSQQNGAYLTALMPVHAAPVSAASNKSAPGAASDRGSAPGGSVLRFVYADEVSVDEVDGEPPRASGPVPGGSTGELHFLTGWPRRQSLGSYHFRGEWERLDHAFLGLPGRLRMEFSPFVHHALLSDGIPSRYNPQTGRGYSDHLPVTIRLTRLQAR